MRHTNQKAFSILSLFVGIFLLFSLSLTVGSGGADQVDFPDIYIDESVASGGVGSLADPYSDFSEINWTTGGDNSVFDYYNNTPAASVTINFMEGETWVEALTVGASGSATYPIIIRSYGSGAQPIIDGTKKLTGWDTGGNWTNEGGQAAAYFGYQAGGTTYGIEGTSWGNFATTFTCPGSGNRTLVELSVEAKSLGGSADNIRVAIFDHGDNGRVAQGTAQVSVTETDYGWVGHLVQGNIDPNPCTLTGGADYKIIVSSDGADTKIQGTTVDNGNAGVNYADYTGGFPDPLGGQTNSTAQMNVRAGVAAIESDLWYITFAYNVCRMVIDGTEYYEAENKAGVNATNRWWYDSGNSRIYVYATENPATAYTTIQVASIAWFDFAISTNGQDYITMEGLNVQGGYSAIYVIDSNYIIIDDCTVGDNAQYGVMLRGTSTGDTTYCEIKNSTIDMDTHTSGLSWLTTPSADGIYFREGVEYCKAYNNTIIDFAHAGITIWSNDTGKVCQNNEVYLNDVSAPNSNYSHGIVTNGAPSNACINNLVYRNIVHDITLYGLEVCGNNNSHYYNIVHSITAGPILPDYSGGIIFTGETTKVCHDNKCYNNVVYDVNYHGLLMYQSSGSVDVEDNLIRNNIIMNWDSQTQGSIYAIYMDDDAGVLDNTWENNCLYKSGVSDVVYYGHDGGDDYPHTVAEFNAENGTESDVIASNIGFDPKFIDASNDDFRPLMGSPCVDAGTDVSLTTDYRGRSVRHAPDIGAYEEPTNALFMVRLFEYIKEKKDGK